jgi:hypothetical protein
MNSERISGGESTTLLATALSVAMHAVVLLVLACAWRQGPTGELAEPQRRVTIVLRPVERVIPAHEPSAASTARSSTRANSFVLPEAADISLLGAGGFELPNRTSVGAGTSVAETAEQFTRRGRHGGTIPTGVDARAIVADEVARLQSKPPQGASARVSVFGGPAVEGRSFIFLIDRSHSMGSMGAWSAAENELINALRDLRPEHRFQVIASGHECVYLNRRELLPATEDNKRSVADHLRGFVPFGGTRHEMALSSALRHSPDVVFLFTDGGDPGMTESQIRRVTELAGGRTAIHCVAFGWQERRDETLFLDRLARENRGTSAYVDLAR